MKARVAGPELADALNWVTRAATATRVTLPALSGVHVHADGDTVTLTATDLEAVARVTLDAEVDVPGDVLVSGSTFAAVAKSLGARAIELVVDADRLEATSPAGRFGLRTMPVDDYPRLQDPPGGGVAIPAGDFASALAGAEFAASRDTDQRATLQVVHVVTRGGVLHVEATDSYRYHDHQVDAAGDFDAMVPARVAGEIRKLIERRDADITVDVDARQFAVTVGERYLSTRLVEGQFPSVAQLVPAPDRFVHRFTVDAEELREAAGRLTAVSSQKKPIVVLDLSPDGLAITVHDKEVGEGETTVDVDVATTGSIKVAAVVRYLSEGLASVQADRVSVSFIDELKPYIVRPADADEASPFALIMPVRL